MTVMDINAEELVEELIDLTGYYGLEDLLNNKTVEEAVNWLMDRSIYKSFRHMVKSFLIDYYRDNYLVIDNPTVGHGLGRWHIQIVDDPERNIYCSQKMYWDSTFHHYTMKDFLDILHFHLKGSPTKAYSPHDICEKCVVGYLRKYRKLQN